MKVIAVGKRSGPKNKQYLWCLCECGVEKEILYESLANGHTDSCGCWGGKRLEAGVAVINRYFTGYKCNATSRGYDFLLTKEEFIRIIKQNCHYCGTEPQPVEWKQGILIKNGIDRKDNSQGYILENVVPCCIICNHAKHALTYDEFIAWIKRLVRFHS